MLDFFQNIDSNMRVLIYENGLWFYVIISFIVFLECGTFVKSFIPGDTVLFLLGSLLAGGELKAFPLLTGLFIAAILGDLLAYYSAKYAMMLSKSWREKYLREENLSKTRKYFDEYGTWGIVIARIVPYLRGMSPFVAGAVEMKIKRFAIYNLSGAILWVLLFVFAGYFFGHFPFVQDHLGVILVILLSVGLIPVLRAVIKYFFQLRSHKPLS